MQRNWRIQNNHWLGLIFMVIILVGLFFILQGLFRILSWIAPILLVLAVVINYRTVIGYGKTLLRLLRGRPLIGILAVLLTIVGFPVVAAYLFGRSLIDRRVKKLEEEYHRRERGDFVDYEDLTEDEDFLELPELRDEERRRSSDYDDFVDS